MESPAASKIQGNRHSADQHACRILAQINRMRGQADLCDVRLVVGEKQFVVHRLVMAASSPYFSALLSGGLSESSKDVVHILGVESDTFQLLLDFIYTGTVAISAGNVQELLTAADMMQLSEVVDLCSEFLKGQIDASNCIGFFQFSEQIGCRELLEFTENYIHGHFLQVQSGEEFLALTKEQLVWILKSEELSIEDEYQVFTASMSWILKDLGQRRRHVVEVLDPVRFQLLPPQQLVKYIEVSIDASEQIRGTCNVCGHRAKLLIGQLRTVTFRKEPHVGFTVCGRFLQRGIPDFSLRVALQTLLKEYCEVSKSPKESKLCSFLQTPKVRPRRKARKYLYAIGLSTFSG